jgi:Ala-tRNA(Pro) deacylase
MATAKLTEFLDANNVPYSTIRHDPTYTAHELASTTHIADREIAKAVVVSIDGKAALAVVPSPSKVDLERVRDITGAKEASLLTEQEFAGRFSGCELGAMPPFGNLYGMDTYVDEKLSEDSEIVFNAGTHAEALRMAYEDFARCVKPKVARLTRGA